VPNPSLDDAERDLYCAFAKVVAAIGNAPGLTADGVLGGRQVGERFVLPTLHDVTGRGHIAHVMADPQKLANALVIMERAGATLAGWIHELVLKRNPTVARLSEIEQLIQPDASQRRTFCRR
jgi:hypothetical protein